jgi:hypothetical protein
MLEHARFTLGLVYELGHYDFYSAKSENEYNEL